MSKLNIFLYRLNIPETKSTIIEAVKLYSDIASLEDDFQYLKTSKGN